MLGEEFFAIGEESRYWSLIIGFLLSGLFFLLVFFPLKDRLSRFGEVTVVRHGPVVGLLW